MSFDARDIIGQALQGQASCTAAGALVSLIAAQGSGVHILVTDIVINNSSATDSEVIIKESATEKMRYPAPADGGAIHHLGTPLVVAANTVLNADLATAATTVTVTALGRKAGTN